MALRIAYKIFSPFIDERIKQKINLLSEGTWEELQSLFHPSQLEEKFGGSALNVTWYWPPYEASAEYNEDLSKFESSNNPEDLSISLEFAPSQFYIQKSANYLKLEAKQKMNCINSSDTSEPSMGSELKRRKLHTPESKSQKSVCGIPCWIF